MGKSRQETQQLELFIMEGGTCEGAGSFFGRVGRSLACLGASLLHRPVGVELGYLLLNYRPLCMHVDLGELKASLL